MMIIQTLYLKPIGNIGSKNNIYLLAQNKFVELHYLEIICQLLFSCKKLWHRLSQN
jgi:hypothetical protein